MVNRILASPKFPYFHPAPVITLSYMRMDTLKNIEMQIPPQITNMNPL